MTDKEIIEQLLDDENLENIQLIDDENNSFEMSQIGVIPMHGVIYAILDLLTINGELVKEEDKGLVMLELDFDPVEDRYYVETVEDDELFDEVMEAYNQLEVQA